MKLKSLVLLLLLVGLSSAVAAQQGAATGEPLSVQTTTLPRAFLRTPYHVQLEAKGGILPLKWTIANGSLPPGLTLTDDGLLSGAPTEVGEYRFAVTVSDGGKPGQQRNQELMLQVVTALLVEWSRYPKITGQRVEGAIKVSNRTGMDFDFTVIMLAVNEIGRATAVGYQHFTLKKDTADFDIPFDENLPRGTYDLNVDAVAEVPATNTIYRARLVPKEKLVVQQGP
jgi:hypothetical protein